MSLISQILNVDHNIIIKHWHGKPEIVVHHSNTEWPDQRLIQFFWKVLWALFTVYSIPIPKTKV